jgi:hypothetical protein
LGVILRKGLKGYSHKFLIIESFYLVGDSK